MDTVPDRREDFSSGPPPVPKVLASREVIGNPHNQTLNVAVQWGVIGIVVLYAMWLLHLLLFRGEGLAAWIGLLVVVQNIFSSLFNSHVFDFHEGWMYVLGVGVAGGMVLTERIRAKQRRNREMPQAMTAGMRSRDELSAARHGVTQISFVTGQRNDVHSQI